MPPSRLFCGPTMLFFYQHVITAFRTLLLGPFSSRTWGPRSKMFQWLSPLSTLGSSARRCGGASEHQGVSFGPLRVCWSHCVKPCGPAAQFPLSALSSLSGAPLPSSGRVQRCCWSCASRSFKRPGRRPGALSTTHLKRTRSQVSEKQGQRHRRSRFQAASGPRNAPRWLV